jgi:hexosaminidase
VLTVRAFHADGRTGDWVRIAYDKCGYAEPVEVEGVRPGLHTEWYFKRFPKCDAIAGAVPDGKCVVDTVQFPDVAKGRRATGIIFKGYFNAPHDGIYTFALASNDGSLLRIDGRLVIDNDGEHTLIEKTGQAAMSAGLHPFELRYFDYNGGRVTLALVDEDGNRVPFGDGWFFHKED